MRFGSVRPLGNAHLGIQPVMLAMRTCVAKPPAPQANSNTDRQTIRHSALCCEV